MIIGVVGSEGAKFTPDSEQKAKQLIASILMKLGVTGYSSGHCHLGGIDIWTEEIGKSLLLTPFIFKPKRLTWEFYKERNIKIAEVSDEVHCITVDKLPENYNGMKFELCYHCGTKDHVKSGGCWTVRHAIKLGKVGKVHVIPNS